MSFFRKVLGKITETPKSNSSTTQSNTPITSQNSARPSTKPVQPQITAQHAPLFDHSSKPLGQHPGSPPQPTADLRSQISSIFSSILQTIKIQPHNSPTQTLKSYWWIPVYNIFYQQALLQAIDQHNFILIKKLLPYVTLNAHTWNFYYNISDLTIPTMLSMIHIPLHRAVATRNPAIVKLLLEATPTSIYSSLYSQQSPSALIPPATTQSVSALNSPHFQPQSNSLPADHATLKPSLPSIRLNNASTASTLIGDGVNYTLCDPLVATATNNTNNMLRISSLSRALLDSMQYMLLPEYKSAVSLYYASNQPPHHQSSQSSQQPQSIPMSGSTTAPLAAAASKSTLRTQNSNLHHTTSFRFPSTPLNHHPPHFERLEIINMLLQYGASINLHDINNKQQLLLHSLSNTVLFPWLTAVYLRDPVLLEALYFNTFSQKADLNNIFFPITALGLAAKFVSLPYITYLLTRFSSLTSDRTPQDYQQHQQPPQHHPAINLSALNCHGYSTLHELLIDYLSPDLLQKIAISKSISSVLPILAQKRSIIDLLVSSGAGFHTLDMLQDEQPPTTVGYVKEQSQKQFSHSTHQTDLFNPLHHHYFSGSIQLNAVPYHIGLYYWWKPLSTLPLTHYPQIYLKHSHPSTSPSSSTPLFPLSLSPLISPNDITKTLPLIGQLIFSAITFQYALFYRILWGRSVLYHNWETQAIQVIYNDKVELLRLFKSRQKLIDSLSKLLNPQIPAELETTSIPDAEKKEKKDKKDQKSFFSFGRKDKKDTSVTHSFDNIPTNTSSGITPGPTTMRTKARATPIRPTSTTSTFDDTFLDTMDLSVERNEYTYSQQISEIEENMLALQIKHQQLCWSSIYYSSQYHSTLKYFLSPVLNTSHGLYNQFNQQPFEPQPCRPVQPSQISTPALTNSTFNSTSNSPLSRPTTSQKSNDSGNKNNESNPNWKKLPPSLQFASILSSNQSPIHAFPLNYAQTSFQYNTFSLNATLTDPSPSSSKHDQDKSKSAGQPNRSTSAPTTADPTAQSQQNLIDPEYSHLLKPMYCLSYPAIALTYALCLQGNIPSLLLFLNFLYQSPYPLHPYAHILSDYPVLQPFRALLLSLSAIPLRNNQLLKTITPPGPFPSSTPSLAFESLGSITELTKEHQIDWNLVNLHDIHEIFSSPSTFNTVTSSLVHQLQTEEASKYGTLAQQIARIELLNQDTANTHAKSARIRDSLSSNSVQSQSQSQSILISTKNQSRAGYNTLPINTRRIFGQSDSGDSDDDIPSPDLNFPSPTAHQSPNPRTPRTRISNSKTAKSKPPTRQKPPSPSSSSSYEGPQHQQPQTKTDTTTRIKIPTNLQPQHCKHYGPVSILARNNDTNAILRSNYNFSLKDIFNPSNYFNSNHQSNLDKLDKWQEHNQGLEDALPYVDPAADPSTPNPGPPHSLKMNTADCYNNNHHGTRNDQNKSLTQTHKTNPFDSDSSDSDIPPPIDADIAYDRAPDVKMGENGQFYHRTNPNLYVNSHGYTFETQSKLDTSQSLQNAVKARQRLNDNALRSIDMKLQSISNRTGGGTGIGGETTPSQNGRTPINANQLVNDPHTGVGAGYRDTGRMHRELRGLYDKNRPTALNNKITGKFNQSLHESNDTRLLVQLDREREEKRLQQTRQEIQRDQNELQASIESIEMYKEEVKSDPTNMSLFYVQKQHLLQSHEVELWKYAYLIGLSDDMATLDEFKLHFLAHKLETAAHPEKIVHSICAMLDKGELSEHAKIELVRVRDHLGTGIDGNGDKRETLTLTNSNRVQRDQISTGDLLSLIEFAFDSKLSTLASHFEPYDEAKAGFGLFPFANFCIDDQDHHEIDVELATMRSLSGHNLSSISSSSRNISSSQQLDAFNADEAVKSIVLKTHGFVPKKNLAQISSIFDITCGFEWMLFPSALSATTLKAALQSQMTYPPTLPTDCSTTTNPDVVVLSPEFPHWALDHHISSNCVENVFMLGSTEFYYESMQIYLTQHFKFAQQNKLFHHLSTDSHPLSVYRNLYSFDQLTKIYTKLLVQYQKSEPKSIPQLKKILHSYFTLDQLPGCPSPSSLPSTQPTKPSSIIGSLFRRKKSIAQTPTHQISAHLHSHSTDSSPLSSLPSDPYLTIISSFSELYLSLFNSRGSFCHPNTQSGFEIASIRSSLLTSSPSYHTIAELTRVIERYGNVHAQLYSSRSNSPSVRLKLQYNAQTSSDCHFPFESDLVGLTHDAIKHYDFNSPHSLIPTSLSTRRVVEGVGVTHHSNRRLPMKLKSPLDTNNHSTLNSHTSPRYLHSSSSHFNPILASASKFKTCGCPLCMESVLPTLGPLFIPSLTSIVPQKEPLLLFIYPFVSIHDVGYLVPLELVSVMPANPCLNPDARKTRSNAVADDKPFDPREKPMFSEISVLLTQTSSPLNLSSNKPTPTQHQHKGTQQHAPKPTVTQPSHPTPAHIIPIYSSTLYQPTELSMLKTMQRLNNDGGLILPYINTYPFPDLFTKSTLSTRTHFPNSTPFFHSLTSALFNPHFVYKDEFLTIPRISPQISPRPHPTPPSTFKLYHRPLSSYINYNCTNSERNHAQPSKLLFEHLKWKYNYLPTISPYPLSSSSLLSSFPSISNSIPLNNLQTPFFLLSNSGCSLVANPTQLTTHSSQQEPQIPIRISHLLNSYHCIPLSHRSPVLPSPPPPSNRLIKFPTPPPPPHSLINLSQFYQSQLDFFKSHSNTMGCIKTYAYQTLILLYTDPNYDSLEFQSEIHALSSKGIVALSNCLDSENHNHVDPSSKPTSNQSKSRRPFFALKSLTSSLNPLNDRKHDDQHVIQGDLTTKGRYNPFQALPRLPELSNNPTTCTNKSLELMEQIIETLIVVGIKNDNKLGELLVQHLCTSPENQTTTVQQLFEEFDRDYQRRQQQVHVHHVQQVQQRGTNKNSKTGHFQRKPGHISSNPSKLPHLNKLAVTMPFLTTSVDLTRDNQDSNNAHHDSTQNAYFHLSHQYSMHNLDDHLGLSNKLSAPILLRIPRTPLAFTPPQSPNWLTFAHWLYENNLLCLIISSFTHHLSTAALQQFFSIFSHLNNYLLFLRVQSLKYQLHQHAAKQRELNNLHQVNKQLRGGDKHNPYIPSPILPIDPSDLPHPFPPSAGLDSSTQKPTFITADEGFSSNPSNPTTTHTPALTSTVPGANPFQRNIDALHAFVSTLSRHSIDLLTAALSQTTPLSSPFHGINTSNQYKFTERLVPHQLLHQSFANNQSTTQNAISISEHAYYLYTIASYPYLKDTQHAAWMKAYLDDISAESANKCHGDLFWYISPTPNAQNIVFAISNPPDASSSQVQDGTHKWQQSELNQPFADGHSTHHDNHNAVNNTNPFESDGDDDGDDSSSIEDPNDVLDSLFTTTSIRPHTTTHAATPQGNTSNKAFQPSQTQTRDLRYDHQLSPQSQTQIQTQRYVSARPVRKSAASQAIIGLKTKQAYLNRIESSSSTTQQQVTRLLRPKPTVNPYEQEYTDQQQRQRQQRQHQFDQAESESESQSRLGRQTTSNAAPSVDISLSATSNLPTNRNDISMNITTVPPVSTRSAPTININRNSNSGHPTLIPFSPFKSVPSDINHHLQDHLSSKFKPPPTVAQQYTSLHEFFNSTMQNLPPLPFFYQTFYQLSDRTIGIDTPVKSHIISNPWRVFAVHQQQQQQQQHQLDREEQQKEQNPNQTVSYDQYFLNPAQEAEITPVNHKINAWFHAPATHTLDLVDFTSNLEFHHHMSTLHLNSGITVSDNATPSTIPSTHNMTILDQVFKDLFKTSPAPSMLGSSTSSVIRFHEYAKHIDDNLTTLAIYNESVSLRNSPHLERSAQSQPSHHHHQQAVIASQRLYDVNSSNSWRIQQSRSGPEDNPTRDPRYLKALDQHYQQLQATSYQYRPIIPQPSLYFKLSLLNSNSSSASSMHHNFSQHPISLPLPLPSPPSALATSSFTTLPTIYTPMHPYSIPHSPQWLFYNHIDEEALFTHFCPQPSHNNNSRLSNSTIPQFIDDMHSSPYTHSFEQINIRYLDLVRQQYQYNYLQTHSRTNHLLASLLTPKEFTVLDDALLRRHSQTYYADAKTSDTTSSFTHFPSPNDTQSANSRSYHLMLKSTQHKAPGIMSQEVFLSHQQALRKEVLSIYEQLFSIKYAMNEAEEEKEEVGPASQNTSNQQSTKLNTVSSEQVQKHITSLLSSKPICPPSDWPRYHTIKHQSSIHSHNQANRLRIQYILHTIQCQSLQLKAKFNNNNNNNNTLQQFPFSFSHLAALCTFCLTFLVFPREFSTSAFFCKDDLAMVTKFQQTHNQTNPLHPVNSRKGLNTQITKPSTNSVENHSNYHICQHLRYISLFKQYTAELNSTTTARKQPYHSISQPIRPGSVQEIVADFFADCVNEVVLNEPSIMQISDVQVRSKRKLLHSQSTALQTIYNFCSTFPRYYPAPNIDDWMMKSGNALATTLSDFRQSRRTPLPPTVPQTATLQDVHHAHPYSLIQTPFPLLFATPFVFSSQQITLYNLNYNPYLSNPRSFSTDGTVKSPKPIPPDQAPSLENTSIDAFSGQSVHKGDPLSLNYFYTLYPSPNWVQLTSSNRVRVKERLLNVISRTLSTEEQNLYNLCRFSPGLAGTTAFTGIWDSLLVSDLYPSIFAERFDSSTNISPPPCSPPQPLPNSQPQSQPPCSPSYSPVQFESLQHQLQHLPSSTAYHYLSTISHLLDSMTISALLQNLDSIIAVLLQQKSTFATSDGKFAPISTIIFNYILSKFLVTSNANQFSLAALQRVNSIQNDHSSPDQTPLINLLSRPSYQSLFNTLPQPKHPTPFLHYNALHPHIWSESQYLRPVSSFQSPPPPKPNDQQTTTSLIVSWLLYPDPRTALEVGVSLHFILDNIELFIACLELQQLLLPSKYTMRTFHQQTVGHHMNLIDILIGQIAQSNLHLFASPADQFDITTTSNTTTKAGSVFTMICDEFIKRAEQSVETLRSVDSLRCPISTTVLINLLAMRYGTTLSSQHQIRYFQLILILLTHFGADLFHYHFTTLKPPARAQTDIFPSKLSDPNSNNTQSVSQHDPINTTRTTSPMLQLPFKTELHLLQIPLLSKNQNDLNTMIPRINTSFTPQPSPIPIIRNPSSFVVNSSYLFEQSNHGAVKQLQQQYPHEMGPRVQFCEPPRLFDITSSHTALPAAVHSLSNQFPFYSLRFTPLMLIVLTNQFDVLHFLSFKQPSLLISTIYREQGYLEGAAPLPTLHHDCLYCIKEYESVLRINEDCISGLGVKSSAELSHQAPRSRRNYPSPRATPSFQGGFLFAKNTVLGIQQQAYSQDSLLELDLGKALNNNNNNNNDNDNHQQSSRILDEVEVGDDDDWDDDMFIYDPKLGYSNSLYRQTASELTPNLPTSISNDHYNAITGLYVHPDEPDVHRNIQQRFVKEYDMMSLGSDLDVSKLPKLTPPQPQLPLQWLYTCPLHRQHHHQRDNDVGAHQTPDLSDPDDIFTFFHTFSADSLVYKDERIDTSQSDRSIAPIHAFTISAPGRSASADSYHHDSGNHGDDIVDKQLEEADPPTYDSLFPQGNGVASTSTSVQQHDQTGANSSIVMIKHHPNLIYDRYSREFIVTSYYDVLATIDLLIYALIKPYMIVSTPQRSTFQLPPKTQPNDPQARFQHQSYYNIDYSSFVTLFPQRLQRTRLTKNLSPLQSSLRDRNILFSLCNPILTTSPQYFNTAARPQYSQVDRWIAQNLTKVYSPQEIKELLSKENLTQFLSLLQIIPQLTMVSNTLSSLDILCQNTPNLANLGHLQSSIYFYYPNLASARLITAAQKAPKSTLQSITRLNRTNPFAEEPDTDHDVHQDHLSSHSSLYDDVGTTDLSHGPPTTAQLVHTTANNFNAPKLSQQEEQLLNKLLTPAAPLKLVDYSSTATAASVLAEFDLMDSELNDFFAENIKQDDTTSTSAPPLQSVSSHLSTAASISTTTSTNLANNVTSPYSSPPSTSSSLHNIDDSQQNPTNISHVSSRNNNNNNNNNNNQVDPLLASTINEALTKKLSELFPRFEPKNPLKSTSEPTSILNPNSTFQFNSSLLIPLLEFRAQFIRNIVPIIRLYYPQYERDYI